METGFGLKEASGELCVGPLGRYVGALGAARLPRLAGVRLEVTGGSGGGRAGRRSRPHLMRSFTGSDVGPDGKIPAKDPEKGRQRVDAAARAETAAGTAGGAGEAEARAGRHARARGAGPLRGSAAGAAHSRSGPGGRVCCSYSPLSGRHRAHRRSFFCFSQALSTNYDDSRGVGAWARCRLGGVPGWDGG